MVITKVNRLSFKEGPMPLPADKVVLSVVVDREVKEALEKIAEEMQMSVSLVAKNVLYVGLDSIQIFQKIGVLKLAKAVRTFKKNVLNIELESDDEEQEQMNK